jgi:tape measure domain-containing protein
MTQSIDKRIVEMAFENSRFEQNVGTSLSSIDKLKKALNFGNAGKSFDGITESAKRVNLNPISDGVSAIANRFSALGIVGIGVLLNLTNSAIEAGKRIVNALVIDPIKTGLNEYETKLNSVQTILANTQKEGTNLETVTNALNDLNNYSDKTIYNFQQMARNIGTFTAAGVKLDASVSAIKGIANLAAISGSNADQASTAMYQLSQALSTGTVRLMDWNSVVNAGMGGQVFQDAVMETARVHGVAIDQIIEEEGSFRDSLQRGWFSSEILTETLSKFTGDLNAEQLRTMGYTEDQIKGIIKMGETANDAATKVKTFSQLFTTLQEAAQSGWAQSWEIIIGDFEEAKSFLTDLNNWFGGIIGASALARNNLLQGWSDLGGRTALLESFKNVLNGVVSIINPIKEGMREIFPPITAETLAKLTEGIRNLTQRLILSGKGVDTIKSIFKGVFALFDIGRMAVVAIGREFGRLIGYLSPVPGGLAEILSKISGFILKVRDTIKVNDTFGKIMRTIGNTILAVASVIGAGISAFLEGVERFKLLNKTEGFLKAFSGAIGSFFEFFKTLDFSILKGLVERITERFAPLSKLGEIIKNAFGGAEEAANPFMEKLSKIASNIREALGKFVLSVLDNLSKIDFSNFDFKGTFDTLNAGLLGALLFSITRFITKGSGIFGSIVDIFKNVSGFAENANGILAGISTVLTGVKDIFTAWQQQIRAGILLKIAGAIAILAISLIALSMIDSEKLTTALSAITLLFANLLGSMAVYEKLAGGVTGIPAMAKAIGAMIGLSVAVLILSGALVKLAKIPTEDIIKGVVAIAALTGVLLATSIALSRNEAGVIRGTGSMILFGLALRTMIGPIKALGAMNTGAMAQGLIGLGVLLAEVGIFMKVMNTSVGDLEDIIGLLILGAAITTLSNVIEQLGGLNASTLTQGLTVLGVLLTGLAGFSKIASGGATFMLTAAGILILSGALTIIAGVLEEIGNMSMEQVGVALTGLAGSLLILGVAMQVMQGSIIGAGAVLIAAAALAILVPPLKALGQMSLEQVGIGLLALAGVFTVLGLAGLVLTPVVPTLLGLAIAVGLLGIAVLAAGVGVGAFAAGLALLATVGVAGGAALSAVLLAIAAVLPTLAIAAGIAIIAFARTIKAGAPIIFEAGQVLLLGFIKSVTQTMPQIIDMVLTGLETLLIGIAEKIPSLVQAGYDILIGFLTGIRDNIPEVVTVSYEIIAAYLNAVAEKIPEIIDSAWNLAIAFIDGIAEAAEENIPRLSASLTHLGVSIVKGLTQGIFNSRNELINGIRDLALSALAEFKNILGIHSPSTAFYNVVPDIVGGLVLGVKHFGGRAIQSSDDLASGMVSSFNSVSSRISEAINSEINFDPSIRPVVDLSSISSGADEMQRILTSKPLNLEVAATQSASISSGINTMNADIGTTPTAPTSNKEIQFIQNNYSPKELSRIEIYRQTKNQLLQVKGLGG